MTAEASKRAKHSAPGQYLGFGLQPVRMCYHLLTAPADCKVSLEHDDDVAVHRPDGARLLVQTKSALSQNPLSDWAPDLWKAIVNWLDTTTPPTIGQPAISYQLYVVPPHTGAFSKAMNDASTDGEADAVVDKIAASIEALPKKPTCYSLVKRFLESTPTERRHLLRNLTVVSDIEDPVDEVRDLLRLLIAPQALDTYCAFAIGLAKNKAEELMRQKKPAIIEAGPFQEEFRQFVSKTNLPALLPFSRPPAINQIASLRAARPTFIRQLEIIDAPDAQCLRAVSDYLRSSADRIHWADAGRVFPDAFGRWDKTLVDQHEAIRDELDLTNPGIDAKGRGRLLYARCRQVKRQLDGLDVEDYFVHGSFHDLSDQRVLGWHSEYQQLIDDTE
jgi:hypothetical protein